MSEQEQTRLESEKRAIFMALPLSAAPGAGEAGPVAYVPRCHTDSWYTIEGEFAWAEIQETPFQVGSPQVWECAPLYLHPAPHPVGSALPAGWVPLTIAFGSDEPEEVAYGPQIMMDRLKKWLDRYYALKLEKMGAAPAPALKGRAAILEAWNDLPEDIRQCPDLAKLWAALGDCEDADPLPEAVKGYHPGVSGELPEPEHWITVESIGGPSKQEGVFTAEQMRAYRGAK